MSKDADSALLELLQRLQAQDYRFVTTTPASHAAVVARPDKAMARTLRDMLGWSLPFPPGSVDMRTEDLLRQAGMLADCGDLVRSRVRVSTLHEQLFLHSAFPTDAEDAVFLGPDSYRFADQIAAELARKPMPERAHILDMGAGAGVGGIVAALASENPRVMLTDVNASALRLARINALAAGAAVETMEGDDLSNLSDPIDLAVINPPYIIDSAARAYRDGGGMHGGELPLEMTRMAAERLAPNGRLLLYTGAAIVDGRNALCEAISALAAGSGLIFTCRETDPDVFGDELASPAYADVERIALVAATLTRP